MLSPAYIKKKIKTTLRYNFLPIRLEEIKMFGNTVYDHGDQTIS